VVLAKVSDSPVERLARGVRYLSFYNKYTLYVSYYCRDISNVSKNLNMLS
jgi:hypothetical protein